MNVLLRSLRASSLISIFILTNKKYPDWTFLIPLRQTNGSQNVTPFPWVWKQSPEKWPSLLLGDAVPVWPGHSTRLASPGQSQGKAHGGWLHTSFLDLTSVSQKATFFRALSLSSRGPVHKTVLESKFASPTSCYYGNWFISGSWCPAWIKLLFDEHPQCWDVNTLHSLTLHSYKYSGYWDRWSTNCVQNLFFHSYLYLLNKDFLKCDSSPRFILSGLPAMKSCQEL